MDFVLDDDGLQTIDPAPVPEAVPGTVLECGPWFLVFPYGIGHGIVEQFELVAVPKAPEWFAGAVNVDGQVLPVVDLLSHLEPQAARKSQTHRSHLLVCDVPSAESTENRMALIFQGLPHQVRYLPHPLPLEPEARLPQALTEICPRYALLPDGRTVYEIDYPALCEALSAELSLT